MTVQKFLSLDSTSNLPKETTPATTSGGSSSNGQIVALNGSGVLDSTLFPAGLGEASQTFPTSENLASGAIVNIYSNSGTATARNANATDATKPAIGFVTAAVTSPATATVFFPGQIVTGVSGLTMGAPVYLGTSSGTVTATAPSATGNLMQQIGYALSATSFVFQPLAGVIRG